MKTEHILHHTDARQLSTLEDNSVELVVTSPPYPMIEMWDELFTDLNDSIGDALDSGNGEEAFELMHDELAKVWEEVNRVLVPGGIAAINIGDATRTIGDHFQVYPNHRPICREFNNLGFHRLPSILWHKPTNSAAKFMGSGMIPPNAYPTLEHENILLFRNGNRRTSFEPENVRYESAYFWEQRNTWFTDLWTDINGCEQKLQNIPSRNRSAAYPIDIPLRLIQMYSVQGDTVLDPFWGTGTTTLAAIATARNSVGTEINDKFIDEFVENAPDFRELTETIHEDSLKTHAEFLNTTDTEPKYTLSGSEIPIVTKQEKDKTFYTIETVTETDTGYEITYRKYTPEEITTKFQNLE